MIEDLSVGKLSISTLSVQKVAENILNYLVLITV